MGKEVYRTYVELQSIGGSRMSASISIVVAAKRI